MTTSNTPLTENDEQAEYHRVLQKMSQGLPITLEDLGAHTGLQNREVKAGLEVGAAIPEIGLPDQWNEVRHFDDLKGPGGLLLVFARTVDWCPYCRNQAAELERAYDNIRAAGIGVALVTVDGAQAIGRFLAEHTVRYPILRDESAELVRRFQIANEHIPEGVPPHSKGMPYPGNFLVGPDGRVVDKVVLEDYQFRPTSTSLVMKHFGPGQGSPTARIDAAELAAEITISSCEMFAAQELGLQLDVSIKPGWHVYGEPLPEGYVPFSLSINGDMFELRELQYPAPQIKQLASTEERLPMYEGRFTVSARLRCRWSAPGEFAHLRGLEYLRDDAITPGDYEISGAIHFQPCSNGVCGVPQLGVFSLPVTILQELPRPANN